MIKKSSENNPIMEKLLASLSTNLRLEKGQEVSGTYVSKTLKELVLDLGTKSEGIISTKEFSGEELSNLKVGDKLTLYVVEPESESAQTILSRDKAVSPGPGSYQRRPAHIIPGSTKQISPKKWEELAQKYPKNEIFKGKVTKINDLGVFVELEEGVEGLIHVSKLGPDEHFEAGENISVIINEIDESKKRIALSPVITTTKGLIYK